MIEINHALASRGYAPTTESLCAAATRRLLNWLRVEHGAERLDGYIAVRPPVRPRCVLIERQVLDKIMGAAAPHLRLWLLLCSDLAIRSKTAAGMASEHYDAARRELRFTTKYQERVGLPVTAEIEELIKRCDQTSAVPFVQQLWHARGQWTKPRNFTRTDIWAMALRRELRKLARSLGIQGEVRPHDMRRTTAVAVLDQTGDLRDVQAVLGHRSMNSTIWYLDHDLRPVKRSTLELIKRPHWAEKRQA